LLVLFAMSCQLPLDRAVVTYRLAGDAASARVFYYKGSAQFEDTGSVVLPWQTSFTTTRTFAAWMIAYNETAAGTIDAAILFDGVVAAQEISALPNGLVSISATVQLED
jgi:hypothetical protein